MSYFSCLFARSGVQHLLCCVFVLLFFFCVPYVARFFGLSIFGILQRLFISVTYLYKFDQSRTILQDSHESTTNHRFSDDVYIYNYRHIYSRVLDTVSLQYITKKLKNKK